MATSKNILDDVLDRLSSDDDELYAMDLEDSNLENKKRERKVRFSNNNTVHMMLSSDEYDRRPYWSIEAFNRIQKERRELEVILNFNNLFKSWSEY